MRKVSDLLSLTEDIQAMKRSVTELISKRDETVDEASIRPPRNDAWNALGVERPNSRLRMIDSYHLCNQLTA